LSYYTGRLLDVPFIGLLKPYLTTLITFKYYIVETTLCEHFEKALAA